MLVPVWMFKVQGPVAKLSIKIASVLFLSVRD